MALAYYEKQLRHEYPNYDSYLASKDAQLILLFPLPAPLPFQSFTFRGIRFYLRFAKTHKVE